MAVAPQTVPEYTLSVAHARVVLALDEVHEAHKHCASGLEVVLKPAARRGVRAKRDFEVGALSLVPLTSSVAMKKTGESVSKLAVVIEGVVKVEKVLYNAVLMPWLRYDSGAGREAPSGGFGGLTRALKPCIVPYWLVRASADAKEVNVTTKTVTAGQLKIKVLVNTKAIEEGAEVVMLQAPEAKSAAPAAPSAPSRKAEAPAPGNGRGKKPRTG